MLSPLIALLSTWCRLTQVFSPHLAVHISTIALTLVPLAWPTKCNPTCRPGWDCLATDLHLPPIPLVDCTMLAGLTAHLPPGSRGSTPDLHHPLLVTPRAESEKETPYCLCNLSGEAPSQDQQMQGHQVVEWYSSTVHQGGWAAHQPPQEADLSRLAAPSGMLP